MKILMLKGSPHKNGTSNLLAEQFMRGAREVGHTVVEFDTAHANIAPCIACEVCHRDGPGNCCRKDDMEQLKEEILQADMLVFATPLYWHNMSAQLKTAIDRMYAFYAKISGKKVGLIVAANNANEHIVDPLVATYKDICRSLKSEDVGMILAYGCGTPEQAEKTVFPQKAYELGKSL